MLHDVKAVRSCEEPHTANAQTCAHPRSVETERMRAIRTAVTLFYLLTFLAIPVQAGAFKISTVTLSPDAFGATRIMRTGVLRIDFANPTDRPIELHFSPAPPFAPHVVVCPEGRCSRPATDWVVPPNSRLMTSTFDARPLQEAAIAYYATIGGELRVGTLTASQPSGYRVISQIPERTDLPYRVANTRLGDLAIFGWLLLPVAGGSLAAAAVALRRRLVLSAAPA